MEGAPQPQSSPEQEQQSEGLPPQLWLSPWRDDVIEAHGFGPRSMYVESCWLPILGPTATWLYRRLGSWAEWHPDGFSMDTGELSQSLGLGKGLGRAAALHRAIDRLVQFNVIYRDDAELKTRIALPPLSDRWVRTLTPDLKRLHQESIRRPRPDWEAGK